MGAKLPSSRGKGRRAPMADINVTPLVDVMLVLLIIFMVTAPLMTAGVQVNLPESRAKPLDQEQKPVQISIDEKGVIYLDNQELSETALAPMLEEIAANAGEDKPQIYLRADMRLDYGKVMRVMGELNRVGLNKVSLVTTPADGG
ncbi:protein TolR [Sphingomonas sp.]|jgi:biopolymer transport protein TolR|uniref:protein TolR n=1 Tax=Sphingomonas sp. TaxID=28214 RepID=UPI003BABD322